MVRLSISVLKTNDFYLDGAVAEIGVTTLTTPGIRGFTTASYQIDLYGLCWNDFIYMPDGTIKSTKIRG